MHKPQEMTRDMHTKLGEPTSPAPASIRDGSERARTIASSATSALIGLVGRDEAREILLEQLVDTRAAPAEPDLVLAIASVCATIFAAYSTAETIGIDLEPFFAEVCGGISDTQWAPERIAGLLADHTRSLTRADYEVAALTAAAVARRMK